MQSSALEKTNYPLNTTLMKPIPPFKKCLRCKEVKPSQDFTKNWEMKDCLKSNCKKCLREKEKQREAAKEKDLIIAY